MTKPIEQIVESPTHFIVSEGTAEESNVGPATIETMVGLLGLGTAAAAATSDFATADQGALADSAIQAADLGTAAYEDASDFAAATHDHAISDVTDLQSALDAKQVALVSGTNIKTVNSTSLLGSGDIVVGAGINGGDASAPGLAVVGDIDTGLFSDAANTIGIAAGGVAGMKIATSAGIATSTHTQTLANSPCFVVTAHASSSSSDTNHFFELNHPTNGKLMLVDGGGRTRWRLHATNGNRTGDIWYQTPGGQIGISMLNASESRIDLTWSGTVFGIGSSANGVSSPQIAIGRTTGLVGFLGAAPVARQVIGDAATDEASAITLVNNIRTALINLGLCSAS